MLFSELR